VRKSLGRHEIATVQTTSIDNDAGLIRLTTVLAHSSGEWISSEFPVCPVSETAAPHRLGAALTYARRYALFTLVGIAGEDDTDAPDLPMRGVQPTRLGTNGANINGNASAAPKPRTNSHQRDSAPPPPTLGPEKSAALRKELEVELAGLTSAEELTAWVTRVLPVKASLTRDDADALERAFAQRMSSERTSHPEGQLSSSNGELLFRPPTNREAQPKITPIPKTQRRRDKKHLRFVSTQPCLVCGRAPSDPHHLRFASPGRSGARSAMNSPYRSVAGTTVLSTGAVMNAPGGAICKSIPPRSLNSSGAKLTKTAELGAGRLEPF
jgi:ERF superfamily